MAKLSRRDLARATTRQLVDGRPSADVMREVAAYLIDHKMVGQADMLIQDIAIALQAETGHVTAEVRSAFALTPASREAIQSFVSEATGAKSVELSVTDDSSLIGGVVIRTPQLEYDASVRRKLTQLARGEN
ncbi:MAG TPA: F0F1 ATP synthase subunit delta [Hymenobacter sp.]